MKHIKLNCVSNIDIENIQEERQAILASLFHTTNHTKHIITVDLVHIYRYNPHTDAMEDVVKCTEHNTKKVIGWLPKEMIAELTEKQMTGFIHFNSKIGYYVTLDKQKVPSRKRYYLIKNYCLANGLPLPAYDTRAYDDISRKMDMNKNQSECQLLRNFE